MLTGSHTHTSRSLVHHAFRRSCLPSQSLIFVQNSHNACPSFLVDRDISTCPTSKPSHSQYNTRGLFSLPPSRPPLLQNSILGTAQHTRTLQSPPAPPLLRNSILGTIRSHYTGTSMYFGDGPWKIFAWCNLNSSLHLKMLPPNATATNLHVHPLWYNLSVARHFCACAQILDVHKNTSVLARQLYRYPLQRRRRRRLGPCRYTPVDLCVYWLIEEHSLIF